MTNIKHEYFELENLTEEQMHKEYVGASHYYDDEFANCKDTMTSMENKFNKELKKLNGEFLESNGYEMVFKYDVLDVLDNPNGYFVLRQSTSKFAMENGKKNKKQALCETSPYYKKLEQFGTKLLFDQIRYNFINPKTYSSITKTKKGNNKKRELFLHEAESGKQPKGTISPSSYYTDTDEWIRRHNFNKKITPEEFNETIKERMEDVQHVQKFTYQDHLNLNVHYNFDRSDNTVQVGKKGKKTYKLVNAVLEAIKDVKANHLSYEEYLEKNKGSEEYFRYHELTLYSEDSYNYALKNQINSLESEKYKVYEDLAKILPVNSASPTQVEYMHLVGYNLSDYNDILIMFKAKRVNYKIYHEGEEDREHYFESNFHWLKNQAKKYASLEDKIIIEDELEKFLYYLQRTRFTDIEKEVIKELLEAESYDKDPYELAAQLHYKLLPSEGKKDKRFIERMVERISKKVAHQYDEENCDTLLVICKKCERSMRNHSRNIADNVKVRKDGYVSTCRECEAERKNKNKLKISIDSKGKSLVY